jgi:hypothetical protein
MEIYMKDCSMTVKNLVLERWFIEICKIQVANLTTNKVIIRGHGKEIWEKAKVQWSGLMEVCMKESGIKIRDWRVKW